MSPSEMPHAPAAALNTSEGGRRYVADFFARELRRNDFTRYITTTLAADFACVLAQHLADRQPGAQVPVGQVRTRVDGGFIAELFPGVADRVSNMAPLFVAPPAKDIDLGQQRPLIARSLAEWHEDDGNVMWWAWCGQDWAGEPAWCGTPNDSDWPGYHTHWTQHPVQPALIDGQRDATPGGL